MPDKQYLELNFDFTIEKSSDQLTLFELGPGLYSGYPAYHLVSDTSMYEKIFSRLLKEVQHIYIVNEGDGLICRDYLTSDYLNGHSDQIKIFKNFRDFISKVKKSPEKYLSGENVILLDDKEEGKKTEQLHKASLYIEYREALDREGINIPILSKQCAFEFAWSKAGFEDFWRDASMFIPKTEIIDVTNVDNFQKSLSNIMGWACEQYILKPNDEKDGKGVVVLDKEMLPQVMQLLVCEEGVESINQLELGREEKKKLEELKDSIYGYRKWKGAVPFVVQELVDLKRLGGYAVTGRMVLILTYEPKTEELDIALVDAFWKSPIEKKEEGEKFHNSNAIASFTPDQLSQKGFVDLIPREEVKNFVRLFSETEKEFLLQNLKKLSPFFKKFFEEKAQDYLIEADQFREWNYRHFVMSRPANLFYMWFDNRFIQHLKKIKYPNLLPVLLCKFLKRVQVYQDTNCLALVDVALLDEIREAKDRYQEDPYVANHIKFFLDKILDCMDADQALRKKLDSYFPKILEMFSNIYKPVLNLNNISPTEPSQTSLQKKALQIANKYYSDGLTAFNAKKYQVAKSYWLAANRVYIKQKNKVKEGSCHSNLASCYRDAGQYGKAVEYAKRALEIKKASSKTTSDELQKIQNKHDQCVKLFEEHENKNDKQEQISKEKISSVSFSF